jgi:homoserine O-acetyltransferase
LRCIAAQTVSIGIDSDLLFPEPEQQFIADMIPRAQYRRLQSSAGHDAFLLQQERLASILHKSGIIP